MPESKEFYWKKMYYTNVLHKYTRPSMVLYPSYMKCMNRIQYLVNSKIYFSLNLNISFEFFSSAELDLNGFQTYYFALLIGLSNRLLIGYHHFETPS